MAARDEILKSIRCNQPQAVELPPLSGDWITYENRRQQFCDVLQSVGGRAVTVASVDKIEDELKSIPESVEAKRICSTVPAIGRANVHLETIEDPHRLEDLDFAVLPGQFGVAENAAVWTTDEAVPHRAVYFIAQHLALVLPADEIVDNMHLAYERLTFEVARFGVFISGPSKTADIEQSLVIGAHGARSLTVFLVDGGH